MDTNIEKLKKEFEIIKEKGWIKSISNSTGSVGITFEHLLGHKENCSTLPDYNGIELKCTTNTSTCPATLLSMNIDGPSYYELQKITNKYGHSDDVFKDKNVIYSSLSCNKDYIVSKQYFFKLEIDKINKKIYLLITDTDHNLIEKQSYVTFNSIKRHLYTKLKYLAIINASKK